LPVLKFTLPIKKVRLILLSILQNSNLLQAAQDEF
jgi:hypothetical protein